MEKNSGKIMDLSRRGVSDTNYIDMLTADEILSSVFVNRFRIRGNWTVEIDASEQSEMAYWNIYDEDGQHVTFISHRNMLYSVINIAEQIWIYTSMKAA